MSGIIGQIGSKSAVIGHPTMNDNSPWSGQLVLKVTTSNDNGTTGVWPGAATETVKMDIQSMWSTDYVDFASNKGVYTAMFQSCGRLSSYADGYFQFYYTNSSGSTDWHNPSNDSRDDSGANTKFRNTVHSTIYMTPRFCGEVNRTQRLRVHMASSQGQQVLMVWKHTTGQWSA